MQRRELRHVGHWRADGELSLEAMAIEYASLRGTTDGMDLSAITDIATYFEEEIGIAIRPIPPCGPELQRDPRGHPR